MGSFPKYSGTVRCCTAVPSADATDGCIRYGTPGGRRHRVELGHWSQPRRRRSGRSPEGQSQGRVWPAWSRGRGEGGGPAVHAVVAGHRRAARVSHRVSIADAHACGTETLRNSAPTGGRRPAVDGPSVFEGRPSTGIPSRSATPKRRPRCACPTRSPPRPASRANPVGAARRSTSTTASSNATGHSTRPLAPAADANAEATDRPGPNTPPARCRRQPAGKRLRDSETSPSACDIGACRGADGPHHPLPSSCLR